MIVQIQGDLDKAISFFSKDGSFKELPFARNFPKNSCEIASAILFLALDEKYSSIRCTRVKGIDPTTRDIHFWVEVAGIVLDPTAHQFPQVRAPFAGVQPQFLRDKFSEVLRESKEEVLRALNEIKVSNTQARVVTVKLFELIRCS
jgi:hypothetical protein